MAEKELTFICAYCGQDTTIIVKVSRTPPMQSKNIPVPYYCEYCNKPNKVRIPDNVDVHQFILGDKGFCGYTSDGIPRLQGEKDI